MLKFLLINRGVLRWLLNGRQMCCQPTRSQVWKFCLPMWISKWRFMNYHGPWCLIFKWNFIIIFVLSITFKLAVHRVPIMKLVKYNYFFRLHYNSLSICTKRPPQPLVFLLVEITRSFTCWNSQRPVFVYQIPPIMWLFLYHAEICYHVVGFEFEFLLKRW